MANCRRSLSIRLHQPFKHRRRSSWDCSILRRPSNQLTNLPFRRDVSCSMLVGACSLHMQSRVSLQARSQRWHRLLTTTRILWMRNSRLVTYSCGPALMLAVQCTNQPLRRLQHSRVKRLVRKRLRVSMCSDMASRERPCGQRHPVQRSLPPCCSRRILYRAL
jgi:hypothetical protein